MASRYPLPAVTTRPDTRVEGGSPPRPPLKPDAGYWQHRRTTRIEACRERQQQRREVGVDRQRGSSPLPMMEVAPSSSPESLWLMQLECEGEGHGPVIVLDDQSLTSSEQLQVMIGVHACDASGQFIDAASLTDWLTALTRLKQNLEQAHLKINSPRESWSADQLQTSGCRLSLVVKLTRQAFSTHGPLYISTLATVIDSLQAQIRREQQAADELEDMET